MSELKLPPSSEEAEKSILGCLLIGGESIYEKISGWIRDDDAFYHGDNVRCWKSIKELVKEREPIDNVTVYEKTKLLFPDSNMGYYISGLTENVPTTANVESYAKIIWEKYIQRETAKSARKLYETSFNDINKTNEILDSHSRLVDELKTIHPSKLKDIEIIVNETKEHINNGTNIISFNNIHLDAPAGGMTRKEITVLGGRPGHGKTTLMINIIRSLLKNDNRVMLFNREMSNTEMMKKMVVMESENLSYQDVRRGNLKKDSKQQFDDTSDRIKEDYKNLTMYDDVRTLDEALVEISRYKPDVIIDDYIQLISMPEKLERRFQLEQIMYEYKWICKKENCSALLLSQLNRAVETRQDPRPRMSDFSESGVIEQTAESAMFVWYPYNFDDSQNSPYESNLISAKTRYGKIGEYVLGFNGNRCKYYDTVDEAVSDSAKENTTRKTWIHEG